MKIIQHQLHKLLTAYVVLFAVGVKGIRVTFNTNEGPISPPPPSTTAAPPKPPYREPAPVWENQKDDIPDPNANWRPPLFVPQTRYTQVVYNLPPPPTQEVQQTSAQRFVSQYLPQKSQPEPIPAHKENLKLEQPIYNNVIVPQLSSQSVPGVGIRYFIPYYEKKVDKYVKRNDKEEQEDAKYNQIESNDVLGDRREESANDHNLKSEKETRKRQARRSQEGSYSHNVNYYSWPVLSYDQRYQQRFW